MDESGVEGAFIRQEALTWKWAFITSFTVPVVRIFSLVNNEW